MEKFGTPTGSFKFDVCTIGGEMKLLEFDSQATVSDLHKAVQETFQVLPHLLVLSQGECVLKGSTCCMPNGSPRSLLESGLVSGPLQLVTLVREWEWADIYGDITDKYYHQKDLQQLFAFVEIERGQDSDCEEEGHGVVKVPETHSFPNTPSDVLRFLVGDAVDGQTPVIPGLSLEEPSKPHEPETIQIKFTGGAYGFEVSDDGLVTSLIDEGQATKLGVSIGWTATTIRRGLETKFTKQALHDQIASNQGCIITFAMPVNYDEDADGYRAPWSDIATLVETSADDFWPPNGDNSKTAGGRPPRLSYTDRSHAPEVTREAALRALTCAGDGCKDLYKLARRCSFYVIGSLKQPTTESSYFLHGDEPCQRYLIICANPDKRTIAFAYHCTFWY